MTIIMEIKGIKELENECYKWHNIHFLNFQSMETTIISAAALSSSEDPKKLLLVPLEDKWFVVEEKPKTVQQATVIPMSQVYAENGNVFPPGAEI